MQSGSAWIWRLGLSLAVSIVILGVFLRTVATTGESVNLARLVEVIGNISPKFLLAYLALQLVGAVFRTERFRVLIRAAGEHRVPPFKQLFLVTVVRNMVVDLFPARLGELVYVGMLNRAYGVKLDACVSSLTISIWFDVAVLVPIVVVLALLPMLEVDARTHLMLWSAVVAVVVLIGILIMYPGCRIVARYFHRLFGDSRFGAVRAFDSFLGNLASAIDQTMQWQVMGRCVLLTLGVRVCKYFALYLLFLAVTAPSFNELSNIGPWAVLSTLIASEASASLPIPAFMAFGTYEAGGVMALTVLGFGAVESALAILSLHVASQFVDYLLGGVCLVLFLLTLPRSVRRTEAVRTVRNRVLPVVALFLIVVSVALAGAQYKKYRKARSLVPPPTGQPAAKAKKLKRRSIRALDGLSGFVVWSSNRFGNHDILKMDLASLKITRLTDHPNSEYFSRISPDGRRVVFARGKEQWVSQRDPVNWDVFLLDLETGEQQLFARDGNQPTWSRDGRFVFFQRNVGEVVRKNLENGREKVLYRSGRPPVPGRLELQTPSLAGDNERLAVTFRGAARMTAIMRPDGSEFVEVGNGCQMTWSPGSDFVYWVDHGGLQSNKIFRYTPDTGETVGWLDILGPFSHEYFPKLSADGAYLVLGASAGGHEHDVADYELFLWKVGSKWDQVVRLTFHTGNDNWPDVYIN